MLSLLLAGDGTILASSTTRAQLPLLLAQASNLSTVAVGQASETDTALAMTVFQGAQIVQVGQATETDTALAFSISQPPGNQFVQVGLASETDTSLSITPIATGNVFVQIGMASETDTALSITYRQSFLRPVFVSPLAITPVDETEYALIPVVVT